VSKWICRVQAVRGCEWFKELVVRLQDLDCSIWVGTLVLVVALPALPVFNYLLFAVS
jgi:hypothetical protein